MKGSAIHRGSGQPSGLVDAPTVDLSVVMVSYNTRDLMQQALRTVIEASAGLQVEITVVDNASHDGSADMVEAEFPQVTLIRNSANVGFATANNAVFRRGHGRYVLLLNTDTIIRPDTLRCLMEFLDNHPETAAAGCKILNPDGTLQLESRRGFPTPAAAFCKLTGLSRLFPNSPRLARYNLTFLDPEEVSEVDALSGSCMMVRREVLEEVGLLDEAYFMYGEDLDWCYRMREAGWKIHYVPQTEIIHFRGESGRTQEMRIHYRKNRAMAIFVQKHMRRRYRFFPLWLLHAGIVVYGLYSLAIPLARWLALPALDAVLVLVGLRLGVTARYHPDLVPAIHRVERFGVALGLDVHPTRWLTPPAYTEAQWMLVFGASAVIWLAGFQLLGLYDRRRYSAPWAVLAVALGFTGVVTTVFFFKAYNFSRLAAAAAWASNTVLVAGWRLAAGWRLGTGRGRIGRRRILVVGTDGNAVQFLEFLQKAGGLDSELRGVVSPERDEVGTVVAGRQVVGSVEDLPQLLREGDFDELIFTSGTISHSLRRVGGKNRRLRVRLVPGSFTDLIGDDRPTSMDDLPLIEVTPRR